jgi:hypothetical protein
MPLPASLQKALAHKTISDGPTGTTTIAHKATTASMTQPAKKLGVDLTDTQIGMLNGKPTDFPRRSK